MVWPEWPELLEWLKWLRLWGTPKWPELWEVSLEAICIYMYLISVFPCWSVFFPIYGRKYSMKIKLFMENMWEFFLVFYFVPSKVNIPMHAGELFYVYFLFHTKVIFPCMQGELNKSYIRNIFVGYKWKFTFQTKPLWGFATVWSPFLTDNLFSTLPPPRILSLLVQPYTVEAKSPAWQHFNIQKHWTGFVKT